MNETLLALVEKTEKCFNRHATAEEYAQRNSLMTHLAKMFRNVSEQINTDVLDKEAEIVLQAVAEDYEKLMANRNVAKKLRDEAEAKKKRKKQAIEANLEVDEEENTSGD